MARKTQDVSTKLRDDIRNERVFADDSRKSDTARAEFHAADSFLKELQSIKVLDFAQGKVIEKGHLEKKELVRSVPLLGGGRSPSDRAALKSAISFNLKKAKSISSISHRRLRRLIRIFFWRTALAWQLRKMTMWQWATTIRASKDFARRILPPS